jgi:uncharacterized protein (DUF1015 family)
MRVRAFRGLRPRSDLASRIPSLPYDVLDAAEARSLAEGDPYSFLHVLKPEIDLDPETSPYDDRVYDTGRRNLDRMLEKGWLVRDPEPAFYVYRLEHGDHSQTGIVGLASLDDYLEGRVKKHELTRPEKEEDRARHMEALSANVGPVLLTYNRVPELSALVNGVVARDADADFAAADGVRHSLWVVNDAVSMERIQNLFAKVPASYIADGHHRAAAASRVARRRREGADIPPGEAPHDWFLGVHFPSHQLSILDYNRIVRDLNGLDPETFIDRVRHAGFDVKENHRTRRPPHRRSFGTYVDGHWFLLTSKGEPPGSGGPAAGLDVAILTDRVLEPILGIGDIRTDRRIEFVGGIRGMDELEQRVDSGDWAVAFAVYPTAIEEVMTIADAGGVMPPKSTWFEPKLRSGMVVHSLDDESLA